LILLTLHFDRKDKNSKLEITQEAFTIANNGKAEENKLGFLWRECHIAPKDIADEQVGKTIFESCKGMVRYLNCIEFLASDQCITGEVGDWQLLSNNVAVENSRYVYKIFDNRFHPTQRKVKNWLSLNESNGKAAAAANSWTEKLDVSPFLAFQESPKEEHGCLARFLGEPAELVKCVQKLREHNQKKKQKLSLPEMQGTPYGLGSVVVIRYKYLKGTHVASKVSHFSAIASQIKEMHQQGIVHGDIRGFNMLHPFPDDDERSNNNDSLQESCVIDFDLSGIDGEDKYPLGHSQVIPETAGKRAGTAGGIMEKSHDWIELERILIDYEYDCRRNHDRVDLKKHGTIQGIKDVEMDSFAKRCLLNLRKRMVM
jgi:hypothetical protein